MSDTIKCACQNCGAKYRLPVESQGRRARCKKCGEVFAVPRIKAATVEDSILGWLDEPDSDEDTVAMPRVINMPKDTGDGDGDGAALKKVRGLIRMKEGSVNTSP